MLGRSQLARRLLLIAFAVVCGPAWAMADESGQNPAPINTFEAEGGYRWGFQTVRSEESWLRMSYKGSLVRQSGTPFKSAQSLDLAAPVTPTASGDRYKWAFRYEGNTTTLGGGLFEAEAVPPIELRILESLDLRGVAFVGGDASGNQVQIAVGLETPALHVPVLSTGGVTHWLVIGVNAQRQDMTDAESGDDDFGLATFRVFLGKAFGWRKSANVAETALRLEAQLLEQAPTYSAGQELASRLESIQPSQRTQFQQLLLDTIHDVEPGENWGTAVREIAVGTADAITDQPTLALYGECSGWHVFSGALAGTRTRALATVTADQWPFVGRDDIFLRLRYEVGYERAVPQVRLNQLLASVSLRF